MISRFLQMILVVFLALTAVFFLTHLTGDPTALYVPMNAPPAEVAKFRHLLGFDRPLYIQYYAFLRKAAHGSFGQSLQYHQPALGLVLQRFPNTAKLALVALVMTFAVAVPAGVVSAANRGRVVDAVGVVGTVIGQAIPGFWLGLLLIYYLGVKVRLLPIGGMTGWESYILPGVTLAAYTTAQLTRLARSTVIDALSEDYIRTARAKGLNERVVLYKHALRNAILPLVTVAGLQVGRLLGGVVIVETVFSWPGLGRLIVQALLNRDYTVVLAGVFFTSTIYSVINFVVDLSYAAIDPRVRYS